jgi:DMSO/TMAO reductase YedYZ molybdopterin-dependent catalytic subunit
MTAPSRAPGEVTPEGRIVRVAVPQNEEFDFARLEDVLTPNAEFYIRSHGPDPLLDVRTWRLEVSGLVDRPLSLAYADLLALAHRETTATLECAGNRRTFQHPVPGGVPWRDGAISTARWGGVPLHVVLQLAGVQPAGRHLLLEGADRCPTDSGPARFARSIPSGVALDHAALIALRMNDEPLPAEHGAPARVVLAGSYAMNSVKWLTRLHVQAEAHDGYFQQNDYRLWYAEDDSGAEIGPMRVMATIAVPRPDSTIAAGQTHVRGAAWTGTGTIVRVEVSTDGGAGWRDAQFSSEAETGVWRLWQLRWQAPPGEHVLMARATDSAGNTQPLSLPPNRKGYANNFVLPVHVLVR